MCWLHKGNKPKGNQRSPLPEFNPLLRTLRPNKEQRLFEIDMDQLGDDFVGAGLRFVQIVVTGSDFDRGRELSQAEYEALPIGEQGAIDYFKKLAGGRETLVEQKIFERLDADRRGAIRYYRQERPRLAELEVWAEGDEILSGMLERGGYGTATQTASISNMIDGEIESRVQFITRFGRGSLNSPEGGVLFDLGAFLLDRRFPHRLCRRGLSSLSPRLFRRQPRSRWQPQVVGRSQSHGKQRLWQQSGIGFRPLRRQQLQAD